MCMHTCMCTGVRDIHVRVCVHVCTCMSAWECTYVCSCLCAYTYICVKCKVEGLHVHMLRHFSHVWLFATWWTVAYQAPLSMELSRQEYWSELPFLSPGDLPYPGIGAGSPVLQADSLLSPGKSLNTTEGRKRQPLSISDKSTELIYWQAMESYTWMFSFLQNQQVTS